MAEAVNQQISDQLTTRHLQVRRVETSLRRDVWAILAVLEAEIVAALKVADPTAFPLLSRRLREVEALVDETLEPLIRTRYTRLAVMVEEAMLRLAHNEVAVVQTTVNDATEEETIALLPSERRLRAGVVAMLFPSPATPTDASATGREWWQRQGEGVTQRLRDSLRVSASLEEPLTQMTARVRGTSALGFQDGIMAKAKQDAARLLTTQVTNTVSEAHVAVGDSNAQRTILIHTSVLDSRTSAICLGRHGLRYDAVTHEGIGHDVPYINGCPYHPSCRSVMTPALATGGPIRQESVDAWLRRRDIAFQDEVLGPTRGKMFRAGKLSTKDLLDSATGKPLTLDELQP